MGIQCGLMNFPSQVIAGEQTFGGDDEPDPYGTGSAGAQQTSVEQDNLSIDLRGFGQADWKINGFEGPIKIPSLFPESKILEVFQGAACISAVQCSKVLVGER